MSKREKVLLDLENFKKEGHYANLLNTFANMSQTTCDMCTRCCTDFPRFLSYPELLLMVDQIENHLLSEEKIQVYKNIVKVMFYEKLGVDVIMCPFLNDQKKCFVYKSSPIFCKLFGVLEESEFKRELIQYLEVLNNTNIKNFFIDNADIHQQLDESINYCTKVKILDGTTGTNNIDYNEFKEIVSFSEHRKLIPLTGFLMEFWLGQEPDLSVPVQQYKQGDQDALERFVEQLSLEKR